MTTTPDHIADILEVCVEQSDDPRDWVGVLSAALSRSLKTAYPTDTDEQHLQRISTLLSKLLPLATPLTFNSIN